MADGGPIAIIGSRRGVEPAHQRDDLGRVGVDAPEGVAVRAGGPVAVQEDRAAQPGVGRGGRDVLPVAGPVHAAGQVPVDRQDVLVRRLDVVQVLGLAGPPDRRRRMGELEDVVRLRVPLVAGPVVRGRQPVVAEPAARVRRATEGLAQPVGPGRGPVVALDPLAALDPAVDPDVGVVRRHDPAPDVARVEAPGLDRAVDDAPAGGRDDDDLAARAEALEADRQRVTTGATGFAVGRLPGVPAATESAAAPPRASRDRRLTGREASGRSEVIPLVYTTDHAATHQSPRRSR